ncbi:MAG: GrpB family protein [Candidatus Bipolaricaulota bacterium]|nr:MAG: GrpB family protein [Candidatus Bipolaricaulota bacterium]
MTEEEILATTIGERRPLNSTIRLAEYDPAWPSSYAILEGEIRAALGARVLRLEHVGSTSVPGLAAKPIIDLVLQVEDSSNEAAYVPPLEARGYVLRIREPDWFEHRVFKTPRIEGNLHVFSSGCEEIETMILFRDRLRSYPEDRERYEAVKRKLAARTWKYTQNYADAKSDIVREILARARRREGPHESSPMP